MPRIRRTRSLVSLVLALGAVGCRDILKVDPSDSAIISVETLKTGSTFAARPTGLFFNAAGIFLTSSIVARDSCTIQRYPPDISSPALDYRDAGNSAMFYSLRYSAPSTSVVNREIGCFFIDDGTAAVPFEFLFDFRNAAVREVRATRVRIAANRVGDTVTHITSTFNSQVNP